MDNNTPEPAVPERTQMLWHGKAVCLIVPLIPMGGKDDDPWCSAFVPIDSQLFHQLTGMSALAKLGKQDWWIGMGLEGVYLLHADGRWEACGLKRRFHVKCLPDYGLAFTLEGEVAGGFQGHLAECAFAEFDELATEVSFESITLDDGVRGRRWSLVRPIEDAGHADAYDDRPFWYSKWMPGAVWPFQEAWELPEPVGALRPCADYTPWREATMGVGNLRIHRQRVQAVFQPGQWPLSLPDHLTRPGPQGWACFPEATVTFFHPPGETLVPVGEQPEVLPEAPTYGMPAEVRLRADAVEVRFGPLPLLMRGKPFRALQYELEEVGCMEPTRMWGSLSLGPCHQILEGRYREEDDGGRATTKGMWFVRLGPRDDSAWGAPGASLPDRMRLWYGEQSRTDEHEPGFTDV